MLEESVGSSPTFWAGLYSWFTPTVFFVVLQLVIGTIYITSTLANNGIHKHHQHQHQEQDPLGPDLHHQQQHQLARSPSVLQRLKSINFYSYPYRSQDPHNTPEFQNQTQEPQQQPQLLRSPSLLQRFKSINLYSYFPTEAFSSKLATTDTNASHSTISHESYEPEKQQQQQQQQHVYDTPVMKANEEKEDEEEEEEGNDVVEEIQHDLIENEESDAVSSMDEIYSKLQGQNGDFTRQRSDTKPASGEMPVKLPKKMKKSASSKSAFSHFKEEDIVESRRPATVREKKVAAAVDDDEVDAKADDFINKFKQQLKLQRLDSIMRSRS